ncbi:MAG: hypothetical protein VXY81_05915 [Pseudomonadota bacterium]|nr:hypothetical protein [Pseudomonadota bacterium]
MTPTAITLNQTALMLDPRGALYWPDRDLLAIADLHFEKGSHFAAMGVPLPPHDTARTLDDVAALLADWRPRIVVCLGDSFHDSGASGRSGGSGNGGHDSGRSGSRCPGGSGHAGGSCDAECQRVIGCARAPFGRRCRR